MLAPPAPAQSLPDIENGRYALAPVADGVVRLDTRSGSISTCSDKGTGWTCTAVPDERAALDAEIGRLQKDNEALRAQLAQQPAPPAKTGEALPKQDALQPKASDGERKIEIPLPSDRDVDRMMSFVENAWRRLVDIAGRMQRDAGGKI
ncbi:MAG: hypothetical protein ABWY18_08200 [Tardiphaga sp.]